jgi:hypothetical protein
MNAMARKPPDGIRLRRDAPCHDRIKGDERILGDGAFVMAILSEADERMDRRYELKRRGYTLEKLAQRVAALYGIDREELYSKGRHKIRAEARSVFCCWAVRELGVEGTQVAKGLQMSQPGVAYAVRRGGEDCESEGHSDDRVIIELQMNPIFPFSMEYDGGNYSEKSKT